MVGAQDALHAIEVASERLHQDVTGLLSSLHQSSPVTAFGRLDAELSVLDPKRPELDTASALLDLLQLRRAAWGPLQAPASLQRIQLLARGLPRHIALDVAGIAHTTVFAPPLGRILLNLLLLGAEGLPGGGTIRLAGAADDLFIEIDGPEAAWPAGTAICLVSERDARDALHQPGSLQLAMTALLARAAGIRLSVLMPPAAMSAPAGSPILSPASAILRLGG